MLALKLSPTTPQLQRYARADELGDKTLKTIGDETRLVN